MRITLALGTLCIFFTTGSIAHAESVVWNKTIKGEYRSEHIFGFLNPNVTVEYRAFVKNADTGEIIAPGGAVPVGTNISLVFDKHVYSDISWFAIGNWWDSPYGDWRPNAAPPSSVQCLEKDFVTNDVCGGESPAFQSLLETQFSSILNTSQFALVIEAICKSGYGYVNLSVAPPAKTITGANLLACGQSDANGSVNCAADAVGRHNIRFNFAATFGDFFAQVKFIPTDPNIKVFWPGLGEFPPNQCIGSRGETSANDAMGCISGECRTFPHNVPVDMQTIDYSITVIGGDGNPPATPTLTSAAACTISTPHSITMVSTDPDGDNIRYGVDWNADGSIDQYVPPSGYVASGSTQSASRTYALAGSKTVKVLAQDEGGLSSSWATLTFSCTQTPPPAGQCSDNADNDGDGLIDSLDPDCAATAGLSEFSTPQPPPPPPPLTSIDLTLRVLPSLVRSRNSTKVHWSTTGVSSCTVTAPNGDSWNTLQSPVGGQASSPITAETTYTLSCVDLEGATQTKQATVRILPSWEEL